MMESMHVGARRNILYIYLIKHATRYQDPGGFMFLAYQHQIRIQLLFLLWW